MKITRIITQHRRDICCEFECEHCSNTYEDVGYDDTNYHENVVPEIECPECGQKSGESYEPRTPRYPDDMIV